VVSMSRALRKGLWGMNALAAAVLLTMMLHVSVNALTRSFLNRPLQNTLELTQYWYLPVIALFGLVTAMTSGEHLGAGILVDRLPKRVADVVCGVLGIVSTAFCAAVTFFSLREALDSARIGLTGGATELPIWPVTFVAPLAFAVLTVLFLAQTVGELRRPGAESRSPSTEEAR
jgi:TRAP-type C4-dicarboxylate transport system, small permease component